jgi:hypothetical protein
MRNRYHPHRSTPSLSSQKWRDDFFSVVAHIMFCRTYRTIYTGTNKNNTLKGQQLGAAFCVGVSNKLPEEALGSQLSDSDKAWCLSSQRSTVNFAAGDVVGCSFDQASGRPRVEFYLNGEALPGCAVVGCKGTVYPALGLSEGAKLKVNFSQDATGFTHEPPRGFCGIIASRSVM